MSILASPIARLLWPVAVAIPACAAATPGTDDIARQLRDCAAPQFAAVMVSVDKGFGGYAIEVGGERYWIAMAERATVALQSSGTREAIARIKISRPPAADFDEQAMWRERWLEDVAARSAVPVERRMLASGAEMLTMSKRAIGGKFAAVSLLVDHQRRIFAEWDWRRMDGYAGPADVASMQETVWRQLLPCAFPAIGSAGQVNRPGISITRN